MRTKLKQAKNKNEIVLVEVKATTGNTKSTNTILDNYDNYKD